MTTNHKSIQSLILTGSAIGLAGGLAEVAVVCSYTALTGGSAASVADGVASAVGLDGASAAAGLGIHMVLAAALGIILVAIRPSAIPSLAFMLGSLAVVWAINFFIVLPSLSPPFVHLLPYGVTLVSKLAFGVAAAGVMALRPSVRPELFGTLRFPVSIGVAIRR